LDLPTRQTNKRPGALLAQSTEANHNNGEIVMAKLIINEPQDFQDFFDGTTPLRVYGRHTEYDITIESLYANETTGYTAVQRAFERINARGENLGVDVVIGQDNWDLI
jgi:hypothetical protein